MNVKSAMRAVYTTNNINGKIHVGEKDLPSIGERDILVYMHAASINPIDWRFIGFIAPFYPFSITLGHDGAGVVAQGVSQEVRQPQSRDHIGEAQLFDPQTLGVLPEVRPVVLAGEDAGR